MSKLMKLTLVLLVIGLVYLGYSVLIAPQFVKKVAPVLMLKRSLNLPQVENLKVVTAPLVTAVKDGFIEQILKSYDKFLASITSTVSLILFLREKKKKKKTVDPNKKVPLK